MLNSELPFKLSTCCSIMKLFCCCFFFIIGGLQYRKSVGSSCRGAERFGRNDLQSNLNVLPKPDNPFHQLGHPFYLARVNNLMDYVDFLTDKFFLVCGEIDVCWFCLFLTLQMHCKNAYFYFFFFNEALSVKGR